MYLAGWEEEVADTSLPTLVGSTMMQVGVVELVGILE